MDYMEIARRALNAAKQVETVREPNSIPPVQPVEAVEVFESCICGPGHTHANGTVDDCDMLDDGGPCECTSYCPPSHSFDVNKVPVVGGSGGPAQVASLPSQTDQKLPSLLDDLIPDPSKLTFNIPPSPETPIVTMKPTSLSSKDVTEVAGEDGCAHLCEKCNLWFSHGLKEKCRYPDLVKYGLCPTCLGAVPGAQPFDPGADIEEDGKGMKYLTPAAQIVIRNKERELCKDMTIEQLSHHIEFIYKMELELRAKSMEARKMRADLIEEEVQNLPEDEREAFRQALLLGAKQSKPKREKKEKTPKESQAAAIARVASECEKAGTPAAMCKLVATWMLKTGKTREVVEAMLND